MYRLNRIDRPPSLVTCQRDEYPTRASLSDATAAPSVRRDSRWFRPQNSAPCQRRSRPLTSIASIATASGSLGLVHRRPHPPRAPVVHERRLELRLHAAVLDGRDEDDVVADLELVQRRALGPGEHVLVEQREPGRAARPRHLVELVLLLRREQQAELAPALADEVDSERPRSRSASSVREPRSTQTRTVGGSAETLQTAVVVSPRGTPSRDAS